ncbi:MAG: hypothetical protein AAFP02_09160, partial [Bacteroidota bacterium]
MLKFSLLPLLLLSLSWSFLSFAPSENAQLFGTDDILHVTLKSNFKDILNDRGDERDYHKAIISWDDSLGQKGSLPIRVKVRGNFRRNKNNCAFPPIRLNFDEGTEGTLFAGQNKVKLVTHCQGGAT